MVGWGTYKTPFLTAGSTKACMRTVPVPMASKKLNWSGLFMPLSEGRRLSVDDVAIVGAWPLPGVAPWMRPLEDEVDGMAVDENERRPAKEGANLGEGEPVLLRFRW